MEVGGQHHIPALLPRERTQIPTKQEVGCTPEPVWAIWRRASSPARAGIRTPRSSGP